MPDRPPRPGRGRHARDGVGGDHLVQLLQAVGGQPRGQVTRDVVEAERREDDHLVGFGSARVALVDEPGERLLAAGVEVVRTAVDRRRYWQVARLQERAGERRDGECAVERVPQCAVVPRIGDTDLDLVARSAGS